MLFVLVSNPAVVSYARVGQSLKLTFLFGGTDALNFEKLGAPAKYPQNIKEHHNYNFYVIH